MGLYQRVNSLETESFGRKSSNWSPLQAQGRWSEHKNRPRFFHTWCHRNRLHYYCIDKPSVYLNKSKKRVEALSSVRLLNDPSRITNIEKMLKRSFTVPIHGYIQRHSLSLTLGTKNKIISEPRPLHDPTD